MQRDVLIWWLNAGSDGVNMTSAGNVPGSHRSHVKV